MLNNNINFYDFDLTLTKKHTFSEHQRLSSVVLLDQEQYKLGQEKAQELLKDNIKILHDDENLSAIVTFHNNPYFIAGISVIPSFFYRKN